MKVKYFNLLAQSAKDYRFWIKLLLGTSQVLAIIIFISTSFVSAYLAASGPRAPIIMGLFAVYVNLSFFTTQSNLLCGIFFINSALFHHLEGKGKFNNDGVAKIVTVYISLTLLLYNIDQMRSSNPYYFNNALQWMTFLVEHSLGPIIAILYYLFFYNHEKTHSFTVMGRTYLWYMILGLVAYGFIFWAIGAISKASGWPGLYSWNGSNNFGEGSHFVYPFFDFHHQPYFFKKLSGKEESIIMLLAMLLLAIGLQYFYSSLVLIVKKKKLQAKLFSTSKEKLITLTH